MTLKKNFTAIEAKAIRDHLRVTWQQCNVDQFYQGRDVALKHGSIDPEKLTLLKIRLI